jgi:hypothetical protein
MFTKEEIKESIRTLVDLGFVEAFLKCDDGNVNLSKENFDSWYNSDNLYFKITVAGKQYIEKVDGIKV